MAYQIAECQERNPKIYQITFQHDTKFKKSCKHLCCSLDGEWKYVINRQDIPEDIYTFDAEMEDTIRLWQVDG